MKDLENELLVLRKNYSDIFDKKENSEKQLKELEVELINSNNEKKELEDQLNKTSFND